MFIHLRLSLEHIKDSVVTKVKQEFKEVVAGGLNGEEVGVARDPAAAGASLIREDPVSEVEEVEVGTEGGRKRWAVETMEDGSMIWEVEMREAGATIGMIETTGGGTMICKVETMRVGRAIEGVEVTAGAEVGLVIGWVEAGAGWEIGVEGEMAGGLEIEVGEVGDGREIEVLEVDVEIEVVSEDIEVDI